MSLIGKINAILGMMTWYAIIPLICLYKMSGFYAEGFKPSWFVFWHFFTESWDEHWQDVREFWYG